MSTSKFESEMHEEHSGVNNASNFSTQTQNWAIVKASHVLILFLHSHQDKQSVSSLPTTVRSSFLTGM